MSEDLGYKNVLCSNCHYYLIIEGKTVKCKRKYFKMTPIKKTTVYTPLDFDCWEYEYEQNQIHRDKEMSVL